MGWLTTEGQTRADLIHRRIVTWEGEGHKSVCLAHAVRGNVLWTVREITKPDGTTVRYIGCDLMRPEKGYGWGYKDMEASSGPCYYTCPLSYLDMAPCSTGPYEAGWRDKVREYHARLNQKLEVGQKIHLALGYKPNEMTVVSIRPLKGRDETGTLYRIPRKALANPGHGLLAFGPDAVVAL